MSNLTHLRLAAREIFDETLTAVDPGAALTRVVDLNESILTICDREIDFKNRRVYSIAIGKAAFTMATALEHRLAARFTAGVISGPMAAHPRNSIGRPLPKLSSRWRWVEGGHPLPTADSLIAGSESFSLLERANEEGALVVFLISGGGSAMIEWPANKEITLDDLRAANQVLVNCGASISEINSVRRTFSAVKGGKLAARAPSCDQITLIVSDVPAGQETNVASGPTLDPSPAEPQPLEVIARYGLHNQLPATVRRAIEQEPESLATGPTGVREHFVLLSNTTALEAAAAAARNRGFIAEIADDISDQPIGLGCDQLLQRLQVLRRKYRGNSKPVCLISGGEFACPVRGDGIGGRNLETALRLACTTNLSLSDTVGLCAGTDGIDGNSPAAGALVDSTTADRARSVGLDANDFLRRSDSYSFFVTLGDTITTGPSGTNVRDIRILLADSFGGF